MPRCHPTTSIAQSGRYRYSMLNKVQGGQELTVIAGKFFSKDGPEALLIGAGHTRPQ